MEVSWENISLKKYTKKFAPLGWEKFFESEKVKDVISDISKILKEDIKKGKIIYPPIKRIYRAFEIVKPEEIKVLICGQDPYHDGNATGLAFNIFRGKKINSSMLN